MPSLYEPRNFNNSLGNGAQLNLIPSKDQYLAIAAAKIDPRGAEL